MSSSSRRRTFALRNRLFHARALAGITAAAALAVSAGEARAEVPVQRTFFTLPASNGHGALILDLSKARLTHFREHLFGSEEPQLDANGNEVWNGNQPQSVATRDLLYDAYFGLRFEGDQEWLTNKPVDLDASGYAGWAQGKKGGTGIVTMVQKSGVIEATQFFFAPRSLGHAGFVMAMRVKNVGPQAVSGVSAFSLHNFHLGFGRPGAMQDIGENGETMIFDAGGGKGDFVERAFAGVVVARPLGAPAHHGASNAGTPGAQNVYTIVNNGGTGDLPDLNGQGGVSDAWVSAYQFDFGTVAPGEEKWLGVAFAHHGDPFADSIVKGWLDSYVAGKGAKQLVDDEIASWSAFQQSLTLPANLGADEETLLRHSAVMLAMAQSKESEFYLREWLSADGQARKTRFGKTLGAPPATLPDTVAHRGNGAVIASLPPGEWTVPWIRDGAYAVTAMAQLGMKDEAKAGLIFYLNAEANRFQTWNELQPYSMPPYQISLVRYYGFGVEETDFNDFGPNLEFDGFGLFLWSTRHYEQLTGDTSLVDQNWPTISTKVGDVLVALVDPATGLLRKDSSIWETHWNGRERAWAYTNITAVRGLCDAAELAAGVGDMGRAQSYKAAGIALREAIAKNLTDPSGAIASNAEELASGQDYYDAAVLDAIAMGLFDPKGNIAKGTLEALNVHLSVPAGAGWSRNDDRFDHGGGNDLSPWGSYYDSAEWVVTDMRGAVATWLMGDTQKSDRLMKWVRDQSLANYLAISETYDEDKGTYKFNAPMIGFGAGVYALALAAREKPLDEPACGAYFDESSMSTSSSSGVGGAGGMGAGGNAGSGGSGGDGGATTSSSSASSTGSGKPTTGAGGAGGDGGGVDDGGCDCRVAAPRGNAWAALAFGAMALAALRRRARRS